MWELAGGTVLGAAIVALLILVMKKLRTRLNRVQAEVEQHSVIGSDVLFRK